MNRRIKIWFYLMEFLLVLIVLSTILFFTSLYLKSIRVDSWSQEQTSIFFGENNRRMEYLNLQEGNHYRILITGDSVVENHCPDVFEIERRLNQNWTPSVINGRPVKKFNVVNGGLAGGYITESTESIRMLWNENFALDWVYLFSGWNEHWYNLQNNPCLKAGCYLIPETYTWLLNVSEKDNMWGELAKNTFLAVSDVNIILCHNAYLDNPEEFLQGLDHFNTSIYRVPIGVYEQEILNIAQETKEHKTNLTLVSSPDALTNGVVPLISMEGCTLIDPDSYYDVHFMYVDRLKQMAEEQNIDLLDLESLFKERGDYRTYYFHNASSDPVHPNGNGNDYCTMQYYEKVLDNLLKNGLKKR